MVNGQTQAQHIHNIQEVLLRFCQAGLCLKKQKCQFLIKSVDYLGYTIDQQGIHPSEDKIKAVKAATTYYGKFLPNLANVLAPCTNCYEKMSNGPGETKSNNLLTTPRIVDFHSLTSTL